ncbi:MAG: hypothetical protein RL701_6053 [Pseudomonadota bacterium]
MKHRLPTLDGKRESRSEHRHAERAHDWAARPTERLPLVPRVVAVAHVNQFAASARLAEQLCAAFTRESATVAALITVDTPASTDEAKLAFTGMMEAGARQAKLLRKPERDVSNVILHAIEELATVDWIIAWGNVVPQLFKPYFTIVVTGHRRDLTHADPLVIQAELEVTAPGPELAMLVARRLAGEPNPER